jgi:hypothetical protein
MVAQVRVACVDLEEGMPLDLDGPEVMPTEGVVIAVESVELGEGTLRSIVSAVFRPRL